MINTPSFTLTLINTDTIIISLDCMIMFQITKSRSQGFIVFNAH